MRVGREGDNQCDIVQTRCYYEDCTCILKLQATCCDSTKALALACCDITINTLAWCDIMVNALACCDIMVNSLAYRASVAVKYLWVDIPIFTEQFWKVYRASGK